MPADGVPFRLTERSVDMKESSGIVFREAIHQRDVLHLLLGFHQVEHASVEFFGEVKALAEENAATGGTIRVCGLRKAALEILKCVGAPTDLHMGASTKHAVSRYLRSLKHDGYL